MARSSVKAILSSRTEEEQQFELVRASPRVVARANPRDVARVSPRVVAKESSRF